MEDLVSAEEKSRWFQELLGRLRKKLLPSAASRFWEVFSGFWWKKAMKNGGFWPEKTEGNLNCDFAGDPSLVGSYVNVKVTESRNWVLKAI